MELKIEYLPIGKLKPYTKNARKHERASIDVIKHSIEKFGMNDAIGIWSDKNIIVEGHGRWLACKELGMKQVPVVRLDHLTDEERRAYALAHNKTAEVSEWDFALIDEELANISEIDMTDLGFTIDDILIDGETTETDFDRMQRDFRERMERGELSEDDEEYQEFLAKFEAKKTTDDCYTPPIVYDAVADYVANKYGLDKNNFVRPFVPNGDYQAEKYKNTDVVVDNPPFSILSEIIKFYNAKGIKFFLFAPHLTIFSSASSSASCVICGVVVTYENGANVCTSFVTNLEECAFRSSPTLYRMVKEANDENLKQTRKELPKYSYPLYVMTSNMLCGFSRYGINFEVAKSECAFTRQLDSQKESGKTLFGSGYLICESKKAEREKAEREKAEREKAEVWELSDREKAIIANLNKAVKL